MNGRVLGEGNVTRTQTLEVGACRLYMLISVSGQTIFAIVAFVHFVGAGSPGWPAGLVGCPCCQPVPLFGMSIR